MLRHVIERALSSDADQVFVAVDDELLAETVTDTEAIPIITSPTHVSGTDRIVEAIQDLGLDANDLVVNVQGDEPLIPPKVINQVAQLLGDRPACGVASLYAPILNPNDIFDPNVVKVVLNSKSFAMYFSRAPLPWDRDTFVDGPPETVQPRWYRHLGIYAYRVWALRKFVSWQPSTLEQIENLEQLRFLENGVPIILNQVLETVATGVDTSEDLARVREEFANTRK